MATSNVPEAETLTLYRGDTFSRPYQALDEDGEPIDLSDKTILAQVRKLRTSGVVVRSFTPYIEDALEGWLSIVMDASVIADMPCGPTIAAQESQYHYDVRIVWPGGSNRKVRTIAQGPLFVSADVSRPVASSDDDAFVDGGGPGDDSGFSMDGGGV